MSKLAFVHDGPIYYDSAGNYYEYAYHGLYERYHYIADEIFFVMRTEKISANTRGNILSKEINVIGIPNFKKPSKYFSIKPKAEKKIKDIIRDMDYVVLRGESSCSNIALKYCIQYKKPYLYEVVGDIWDMLWNYSMLGKIMAPYCTFMEKRRIRNAGYVYYVTEKYLQEKYPTNGKSIGCSNVVIEESNANVLGNRLKKIENRKERLIIGTAAAIDVRYKGQEDAIKAISYMQKSGYEIFYKLAGGNRSGSDYLMKLAEKMGVQEKIIFCGSLNSEEMLEFYDSLDIYIQPSKQEGLPRAVIEAMNRGCPIVASRIAGIPELIDEECMFSKGNIFEIIEVIKKMVNEDLRIYATRNFEKAKEYSIDKLENRRKQFYDLFIAENQDK